MPPDTWFTQEVEAVGDHIVIKVNGKTTVDYVDPKNISRKATSPSSTTTPRAMVAIRKIEVMELDAKGN